VTDRPASAAQGPSVAIAINDKTRPVPHKYLLPPLLARLEAMGVAPEAITLIIATGAHPPIQPEEFGTVIPQDILNRYPSVSHDAEAAASLVYLGDTTRGTPVWANRRYIDADLRIVVGDIEPHQFMGFSGGVKSAAIGLAGKLTVNANHAMMSDPKAQIGRYEDNPCRQDVEEIGRMMGVHFALNAVLNEDRRITGVFAGDPVAVMHAGIPFMRDVFQVVVAEPFDLMIVSPGGHPKDINVYQAQKALGHATLVMKPGGTVVVAAACPEGAGSQGYEDWMADPGMTSHDAVLERYGREGFRLGPHKAFQISRDAGRVRLLFVSDMAPDFARRLLLNPVADRPGMDPQAQLERAVSLALRELAPAARVGVMPWANATIPILES
jgi:nickel-dependent lactate racemase